MLRLHYRPFKAGDFGAAHHEPTGLMRMSRMHTLIECISQGRGAVIHYSPKEVLMRAARGRAPPNGLPATRVSCQHQCHQISDAVSKCPPKVVNNCHYYQRLSEGGGNCQYNLSGNFQQFSVAVSVVAGCQMHKSAVSDNCLSVAVAVVAIGSCKRLPLATIGCQ